MYFQCCMKQGRIEWSQPLKDLCYGVARASLSSSRAHRVRPLPKPMKQFLMLDDVNSVLDVRVTPTRMADHDVRTYKMAVFFCFVVTLILCE